VCVQGGAEPVDLTISGTPVFKASQVNSLSSEQLRAFIRKFGKGYVLLRDAFVAEQPRGLERLVQTGKRDQPSACGCWRPSRHGKYLTSDHCATHNPCRKADPVPDRLVLLLETSEIPDVNAEKGEEWQGKEARASCTGPRQRTKPKAAKGTVTSY
jgi:hypothetical protein